MTKTQPETMIQVTGAMGGHSGYYSIDGDIQEAFWTTAFHFAGDRAPYVSRMKRQNYNMTTILVTKEITVSIVTR